MPVKSGTRSKSGRKVRGSDRGRVVEPLKPRLHETWWAQLLLLVWRWRAELLLVVILAAGWWYLAKLGVSTPVVVAVLVGPWVLLLAVPQSRRFTLGWFWTLVVRHRLRAFLVQTGATNRSGKLPLILAAYPTPVGVRVWLVMIAGMSVESLGSKMTALAATCWARDARVQATKKAAHVVRVDVIRHDPLASPDPVVSQLVPAQRAGAGSEVVSPSQGRKPVPDWVRNAPAATDLGLVADDNHRAHFPEAANKPAVVTGKQELAVRSKKTDTKKSPEKMPDQAPAVVHNGEDVSDYVE